MSIRKRTSRPETWIPIIVALITVIGSVIVAFINIQKVEINARQELQPTISALEADVLKLTTRPFTQSITLTAVPAVREQVCSQVNITAMPGDVTVETPAEADAYNNAHVVYTLEAPSQTGMRILFHIAEHLVDIGSGSYDTIAFGRHIEFHGISASAGKSTAFDADIYMSGGEAERAKE